MLYAAHERRAAAESRGLERVNTATIREAAKYEGEIASLQAQIARGEQQLRDAQAAAALAGERRSAAEVLSRDAGRRADEAERQLAAAESQGDALREEVERLRVSDVGEMEAAWGRQLEQLRQQQEVSSTKEGRKRVMTHLSI